MHRFIMLFAKVILTILAILYGELCTKAALNILLDLSYLQLSLYYMGQNHAFLVVNKVINFEQFFIYYILVFALRIQVFETN